jgi:hypothetical protein
MAVTYVYGYENTENIVNTYSSEDYGLISAAYTSSEDIGSITTSPTNNPNTNENDWYQISVGETLSPFGNLNQISSSQSSVVYQYISSGILFEISQTVETNITFTWVGNGTLFEIGNGLERTLRPYVSSGTLRIGTYTEPNEVLFSSPQLTFAPSESAAFGEITTIDSEALVSFAANPPEDVVLYNISGVVGQSKQRIFNGTGQLTLSGELIHPNIDYTPSPDGSGSLTLFGSGNESYARKTYIGSGSLFGLGSTFESRTFIYNEESIVADITDWGSVASTPTAALEDWGTTDTSGSSVDWGSTTEPSIGGVNEILIPFGNLTVSGFSSDREIQVYGKDYVTSGTITLSGELIHPNIDYTPSPDGSGLFNILGSAAEAYSAQTPEDTQLFSVSGISLESFSKGLYTGDVPLYSISGSSSDREIQVYGINPGDHLYPQPPDISSGLITISGELLPPNIDFTPKITASGLITISGNLIESETDSYIGLGTLFGFGSKFESRTYIYDETSIVEFTNLDYGFISSLPNQFSEDYGDLSPASGKNDYGVVVDSSGLIPETLYPFGSIYILGPGLTSVEKEFTYIGIETNIVISGFSSDREIQVYGKDYITSGTITLSQSLIEKDVDSYVGVGTLNVSGTALEALSAQTPENTQLFSISGVATERVRFNPPEDFAQYTLSGTLVEKNTESYDGLGTIFISDQLIEKDVDSYVGVGTLNVSGTALEALSAQTPENTQLFSIFGTGIEKDVDSYVGVGTIFLSDQLIEKEVDSYVGVGTIFVSGQLIEKDVDSYVGVGTLTISGDSLEGKVGFYRGIGAYGGFSSSLVERVSYDYVGFGTIFTTISSRNYSNVYPGLGGGLPDNPGIGTIRINDDSGLTVTRALLPYKARGQFNLSGLGLESFTRTTYIGSGIATFFGIASTREIAVYQGYETGGLITISQQTKPITERITNSYSGSGTFILSGQFTTRKTYEYEGLGTLNVSGTALEALSAQTPENTQLFSIFGTSLEVYSAQTPEIEVLYIISGTIVERKTNSFVGSGTLTVSGFADPVHYVPNYSGSGLIRFVQENVDNDYDTCDSVDITCDEQTSANVSFVANPPENTILFELNGNGLTRTLGVDEYITLGSYSLYGTYQDLKSSYSEIGIGTILSISSSTEKESDSYVGSGALFGISGVPEYSYTKQIPDSTILFEIGGSSTTKVESEYSVAGIGLFNFNGNSETRNISVFAQNGLGSISLSGELVHPDIRFVPSAIASGSISIIGESDNSITKIYLDASGTLFEFSSGFESFSRSTYIGIGSIYIESTSGISTINQYQIPRTYVVII